MRRSIKFLMSAVVPLALGSGCALILSDDTLQGADKVIEDKGDFTKVDLPAILDPQNFGPGRSGDESSSNEDKLNEDKLENAFSGFYSARYGDVRQQKLRRNRVVDRLVAASIQRCKEFKERLKLAQSQGNFTLGTLTTALAGAAAIFTPVNTTRTLAGSASVLSGVRAELNENLFSGKIVEVLTRAIDNLRDEILKEIDQSGKKSIEDYSVERAVADALRYHSTCNLLTGLELLNEQVTVAKDPGLKRLSDIFSKGSIPLTMRIGDTTINTMASNMGFGGLSLDVGDVVGAENSLVDLTIGLNGSGPDGIVTIEIAGVPTAGGLTSGTLLQSGMWLLERGELNGLRFKPPKDQTGNYPLNVTVKIFRNGAEWTIRKRMVVVVVPENEPPTQIDADNKGPIPENAVTGTEVLVVTRVHDANTDDTHSYSLTDGSDLFEIDDATGVVSVKGQLDYETTTSHKITVEATDNGIPPLKFLTSFQIDIEDIND